MLQRLPYLGRVGSGNPNRTFIDDYAKSGLRGLSLVEYLRRGDKKILNARWQKPLGDFGAKVVCKKISDWAEARKYGRLCISHGNYQVMCDIVCAELETSQDNYDFTGIGISNSFATTLDFSAKSIKGLNIENCIVDLVELENSDFSSCEFKESEFSRVSGVASQSAMPPSFKDSCHYSAFTDVDASSRISSLPISNQHKTLIMIIQKLFFQRGRGRKEEALLRGSSPFWDADTASSVIHYMIRNGIIIEAPGKSGKLFVPQLAHKSRMRKLKDGMSTSGDELWTLVTKR